MDVLFDTINVQDLLSSPESASSPLSAPDLRLLISRLDAHSLRIKSTVQSYLLAHHDEFASLFSQCSDIVSRSERLSDDVVALLKLICDQPIEADVGRIVRKIVEKRLEAREKREVLQFVGVVLELDRKFGVVRDDVKSGRVVEAADGLRELKIAIGVGGGSDAEVAAEGEPEVYGILKRQWTECFEEIQELLLRFMEKAVKIEQGGNALHIKHQMSVNGIDGLELYTVLKALDVAGILDYGLAKVADLIIKYVLTPLVSCTATPYIEEINQDSGHAPEAVFTMVPSVDPGGNKVNGEIMYSSILKIVEFVNKFLVFQNSSWMCCFGRLTWPRMSDMIISNFLSKVVPDDASKLAEFQEVRKLTIDFEAALKELGFISPSDIKDEKLSRFADNVEVHFASRKKVQILSKARNMLLQSNFSLPQDFIMKISGVHKEQHAGDISNYVVLLFSSEKCVVSEAAKQLMELVHQTLKDVCLLPPKVGLEFYHAARKALVLYEAIIPVKLQRQLDSINQAAVLIHNDCLYLSQEILGLAFEYRPYFPSSVKEHVIFIDLAPRFQLMAEDVLKRQIQLVLHNLNQAVDGADGFQNTHQIKQFESAKFCIDQVCNRFYFLPLLHFCHSLFSRHLKFLQVAFIIEKVHIIWEPLLLPSIYEKSMTMILESVFSRIVKEILLLDDMAAEETLQLQRLIHLLFEHLSSLLEPLLAFDRTGRTQDGQNDTDSFILSIRKLRKLAELLDMPLKSITEAWESGELSDCNLTSSEVEDFIRAIFTDSPLRKECLFRIENSNMR
ncbi:Centromere/kinetochore protein zw10 homolog [Striga hermonthica]|uniref:Centromere/kinetochore protein zw10 homolog n=1 Tax=Striga hermonthica TaxID=68872 RepID=A0A9N7R5D4_STRHE|nr:Centromere/kinetochore protein zw10 homolog [Striga hermonthica]